MAKKTLNIGGKKVEAESLEFETLEEGWNIYKVSDGFELHFKTIVTEIFNSGEKDPMTQRPVYLVLSKNVTRVLGGEDE